MSGGATYILSMIDKQIIEYMAIAHGFFNTVIALAILYQGWCGLRIRRTRIAGAPDFALIRTHRKLGPFLVLFGTAGFLFGVTLARIDQGKVFTYPLHFILGALIALSLLTTFIISRKIKAGPLWRTPHFAIGVAIVVLYALQVLVGLTVLF